VAVGDELEEPELEDPEIEEPLAARHGAPGLESVCARDGGQLSQPSIGWSCCAVATAA
jgi:hypothetical protein